MAIFGRNFPIPSDAALKENVWLRDLFCRWHPSGATIDEEGGEQLRLAIRNGSLNFYRAGQSVAKVEFIHGQFQAEIHKKYVYGDECGEQGYVKLTSKGFPERGTGRPIPYDVARLQEWIAGADRHSCPEKRFVDLVVGRNPNVVDLEMGLPAYSEKRNAPRMDLVGLEPKDDQWRVVFWEAKLADDGRARSRGEPRVICQLKNYTDWLGHPNHLDDVARAYQSTCCLLVKLHAAARRFRSDIEELGPGILAVAAPCAPCPSVCSEPRLLIDARPIDAKRIAAIESFTGNRHLDKLKDAGLHVQMVHGEDQMTLDTLP